MSDSLVDVVAKKLVDNGEPLWPNWPLYRDWARDILEAVARSASHEETKHEINSALASPDREVTHEEMTSV